MKEHGDASHAGLWVTTIIAVSALALAGYQLLARSPSQNVSAREIVLKDPNGSVRARLGPSDDGYGFTLYDENSKPVMVLAQNHNAGGSIDLIDGQGEKAMSFDLLGNTPVIRLGGGASGSAILSVTANNGAMLNLSSASGTGEVGIDVDESAATLRVRNGRRWLDVSVSSVLARMGLVAVDLADRKVDSIELTANGDGRSNILVNERPVSLEGAQGSR